jgi:hypothetical protein
MGGARVSFACLNGKDLIPLGLADRLGRVIMLRTKVNGRSFACCQEYIVPLNIRVAIFQTGRLLLRELAASTPLSSREIVVENVVLCPD